jgi:hypothetical protein
MKESAIKRRFSFGSLYRSISERKREGKENESASEDRKERREWNGNRDWNEDGEDEG